MPNFILLSLSNRFSVDERSIVSHLFNEWAKKQAFQDPKRLLDKVDENYTVLTIDFLIFNWSQCEW